MATYWNVAINKENLEGKEVNTGNYKGKYKRDKGKRRKDISLEFN